MEELLPSIRSLDLRRFLARLIRIASIWLPTRRKPSTRFCGHLKLSPGDELIMSRTTHTTPCIRHCGMSRIAPVQRRKGRAHVPDASSSIRTGLGRSRYLRRSLIALRLLLIDHVTSPTATSFSRSTVNLLATGPLPMALTCLVDGAHGTRNARPLDLNSLERDVVRRQSPQVGLHAPVGAAFIVTDPESLGCTLHPAIISHGYEQGHV